MNKNFHVFLRLIVDQFFMDNALNKYLSTANYEPGTTLQNAKQNACPQEDCGPMGKTFFFKYLIIKLEL